LEPRLNFAAILIGVKNIMIRKREKGLHKGVQAMEDVFSAYFPVMVVVVMAAFMVVLGGLSLADALHERNSAKPRN
jgi:hypothetical protein